MGVVSINAEDRPLRLSTYTLHTSEPVRARTGDQDSLAVGPVTHSPVQVVDIRKDIPQVQSPVEPLQLIWTARARKSERVCMSGVRARVDKCWV